MISISDLIPTQEEMQRDPFYRAELDVLWFLEEVCVEMDRQGIEPDTLAKKAGISRRKMRKFMAGDQDLPLSMFFRVGHAVGLRPSLSPKTIALKP